MTGRVPELDGIRGIAILLIVIVHFGDYAPVQQTTAEQAIRAVIAFGWTGVDLFFVLSGCLITGILLTAKGSPHYFRSFYARRALRILPLYYLSVAGFFWLVLPAAHAQHRGLQLHASEQVWYWLYLSNWRIAFDEYAVEPLSHFWSLAIEEQFYLIWPLIVFLVSESKLLWVCLAVILGALGLRCLPSMQAVHAEYSEFLYALTPFRMDTLAFGALLALTLRSAKLTRLAQRWLGSAFGLSLFGIGAAMFFAKSVRPFSAPMGAFGYSAVGLLYASIVMFALLRRGSSSLIPRLLRHPLLRSLGKYSYAMYVIHWPISLYLTEYFQSNLPWTRGLPAALLCIATGLALSYGLAVLSWNLVEKHFLRLRDRFPYSATSIEPGF